jgi:ATP phosphoribosyltransferase regulatory subunit
LGIELFARGAVGAIEADAEVARLTWRAALAGGREDLVLWLGDGGLFSAFIDSLSLPQALAARLKRVAGRPRLLNAELARAGESPSTPLGGQLAAMLSGLSEPQAGALLEEVWALAGVEPVGGRGPSEIAARLVRRAQAAKAPALTQGQAAAIRAFMAISEPPASGLMKVRRLTEKSEVLDAALADWEKRLALMVEIPSDRMRFAPALGHTFDYYNGLTFEVRSEALGADRPVASGGRYDDLLFRLGGPHDARAVGCVVRPWRAYVGGEI